MTQLDLLRVQSPALTFIACTFAEVQDGELFYIRIGGRLKAYRKEKLRKKYLGFVEARQSGVHGGGAGMTENDYEKMGLRDARMSGIDASGFLFPTREAYARGFDEGCGEADDHEEMREYEREQMWTSF